MSNATFIGGSFSIGLGKNDLSGPTLVLAPADSAAVSDPGTGKIRYNSVSAILELSVNAGPWTAFASAVTGAPSNARFIIQQPNSSLPNAQALSALTTGLVKNTTGTGILTTAIANTDFPAVNAQYIVATATNAPASAQNLGVLTSGILKQTVSAGTSVVGIALPDIDYTVPNNIRLSNIAQLASQDISNLSNLILRWVATVRSFFYLDKTSTLTANGISIVTASGGIGRWIRTSQTDPFWTTIMSWFIDASNVSGVANDENDGRSTTTPLLTHEELERRLGSYVFPTTVPTITFMSDVASDKIINVTFGSAFDNIFYTSDFTQHQIGSGTITSLVTPNKTFGSERWWEITDTSIPVSWTASGFIDKWIVFFDVSNNVVGSGPIIKDLGSKTMRVGALTQTGILPSTFTRYGSATIANGNTYRVYDKPTINCQFNVVSPYVSMVVFGLHFTQDFFVSTPNNFINFASNTFSRPGFLSRQATGSTTGNFFNGASVSVIEGRIRNFSGSTLKNTFTSIEADGWGAANGDIIMQNSALVCESSSESFFDCDIGFFDCDATIDTIFDLKYNSKVLLRGGTFWGFNNAPANNVIRIQSANCLLMYSFGSPPRISHTGIQPDIEIFSTGGLPNRRHSWADLPVSYDLENTGIIYSGMQPTPAIVNHPGFSVPVNPITTSGVLSDITAGTDTVLGRVGSANLAFSQVATTQIANSAITNAKFRQSSGTSVVGVSGSSTANVADITATSSGQFLRRDGSNVLGFGSITLSDLPAGVGSGNGTITNVIAGSGIAGGGTGPTVTLNIGTSDSTISVAADTIAVGVITTANIANNAIDNNKIRDSVATSVIGRSSNSSGDPDDIQATVSGQFLRRDGSGTLGFGTILSSDLPTGVGLGDVRSSLNLIAGSGIAGGGNLSQDRAFNIGTADSTIVVNADTIQVGTLTSANIPNNLIDNTKIRDSIATSVIGRSVNSAGDPADIQATVSGQFLRRDGSSVLGFGTILTSDLPATVGDVKSSLNLNAGAGLVGGGNLTQDRTFDIVAADGTIVVNPDSIQVGVLNTSNYTDGSVTSPKLRNSIATSVIGRSTGSAGVPADIQATASGQFLRRDGGGTLGFGTIVLSDLPTLPLPAGLAAIATSGSASDLVAGTVPAARLPAFTGDATSSAGTVVFTLATVATPGTAGDASHVAVPTINAKGLVTNLGSTSIAINASAVASGNLAQARLPVASTGTVLFGRSGGGYDSDSVTVIDSTNHRLGVNQASPTHTVDIGGTLATSGDITAGNNLTVTSLSTLSGHVDANNGLAVNNAILTANATGTAFAVTAGNADLQHDAHVGGDLTVDGHIYGTIPWTLPFVCDQSTPVAPPVSMFFLAPSSVDREQSDLRFGFAGYGRASTRQSLQVVMNSSLVSPGGGAAGYSVTFTVMVNGVATALAVTVPLTPAPGSSNPTLFGTTTSLTIADGSQISLRESGAITVGSPSSMTYNAYLVLTLF